MKFLAVLRDSFRETLDRKSFLLTTALSSLLILFCAGISFAPLDEREAMKSIADGFAVVSRLSTKEPSWATRHGGVKFEVTEFRTEPAGGRSEYRFRLQASPPAGVHRLIRHWLGVRSGKCKAEADPIPEAEAPTDPVQQSRFLEARFREGFIPDVEVEPAGDLAWKVTVQTAGPRAVAGAEEMKLFFGAVKWRPRLPAPIPSARRFLGSAEIMNLIHLFMAQLLAGWVGLFVAVIVTSGFVPRMLEKGTLDLLLSRPLERSALLASKYLGGCLYVFLNAAFLIGGCWLALSIRTGYWNFHFPLTILNLTFLFAVLYSVSVLAGVLTRSVSTSAFVTILVWGISWKVGHDRYGLFSPEGAGTPSGVATAERFAHLLLPKVYDLLLVNEAICARGALGESAALMFPGWLPHFAYGTMILTSALFATLMISLACVKFSKNDY